MFISQFYFFSQTMTKKVNKMEEKNNIEPIDFPPILYKYMPEWPYALNTLTTRYFYFSPITEFNDPFEGKFFDDGQYSKEDIRHYFRYSCHASEEYMKSLENILSAENWDEILKDLLKREKEKVEQDYGLLCLSKKNEDILMWSHYANSHKGIVIGIDSAILLQNIISSLHIGSIKSVKYESEYPKTRFFCNQTDAVDKWFFTKYKEWEYEEEYRAIHKPGLILFPNEIIRSVYFGAKFDLKKRDFWIKQIIDSGIRPAFYQTKLNEFSYKINFNPIAI